MKIKKIDNYTSSDSIKNHIDFYPTVSNMDRRRFLRNTLICGLATGYPALLFSDADLSVFPEEWQKYIVEAVGLIRKKVGNGVLLLQHNMEYGFFRNLIGGSVLSFMVCLANAYLFFSKNKTVFSFSVALGGLFLFFVLLSKPILRRKGNLYAKTLFQEYLSQK